MKRAVVAVLGFALLLVGVALLVLPGPGFLVIAAALALLSTQFRWAKVPLAYAWRKADEGVRQVARSRTRVFLAGASALGLIAIGVVRLAGVHIWLVGGVTAVLLILSGGFLAGTLAYALNRSKTIDQRQNAGRSQRVVG